MMHMKNNITILLMLPVMFLNSCAGSANTSMIERNDKVIILQDVNFDGDFSVLGTSNTNPVQTGILRFENNETGINTVWKLAQWGSKHTISTAKLITEGNSYIYENVSKRIVKDIVEDGENILTLAVYASNEYKSPRKTSQMWPHLLIEQTISDSYGFKGYEKILFTIDVRISQCENKMSTEFDQSLHCAQTTAYFTVSDQNIDSKGYGDFLWFGIPIFDSRFEYPPGAAVLDNGTAGGSNKLIYTPPGNEILSQNLMDGNWEKISIDLLPYIKKAFEEGRTIGYLPDSSWEDMKFTSFNLGWEVPGTFDVEMQIKNLSCIGIIKRD